MKIGFSLGRCIRDIVDGLVSVDDVAFIIAATNIREEEMLGHVIEDYGLRADYLAGRDIEAAKAVALELWNTNKILQPRRQGLFRHKQPENSIWVDMYPTAVSDSDSVKKAWDNYRFMIHMVENVDNDAMDVFK